MTRDYRAEHERNGIVYCGCENCKSPVLTGQKGEAMNLPSEVKRAMSRLESVSERPVVDGDDVRAVTDAVRDLLSELKRFERSLEATAIHPNLVMRDVGREATTEEFRKAWDAEHPTVTAAMKAWSGRR